MKRIIWSMTVFGLVAGVSGADGAEPKKSAKKSAEFNFRGIIRAGVDKDGRVHGKLAQALPEMRNATSLNYKVLLLDENGKLSTVDEEKTAFRFGQKFRLEIEADTDLYLYVFHQGPDGIRTVLLPDSSDEGRVPFLKRGETKRVPEDLTWFEFVPPAGEERLLVYASKERNSELTPQQAFEEGGSEIKLKSKQDKLFSKAKPKVTKRIDRQQVAAADEDVPKFLFRGLGNGITFHDKNGKTVIQGSTKDDEKPSLFVEISLKTKEGS